ncbi:MAG: hypothetical protein Q7S72_01525, partial [Candidatus Taylorbacteria bacterium]|nr:hypothetical protein [Candidatus Taylorbacteria bacterium]
MNPNPTLIPRIRIIVGCVIFCACIIIVKLAFIQIVEGDIYSARADKQYVRRIPSNFDRGSIFFTSKDGIKVAAATVKDGYNLSINPKLITDGTQAYEALSQYLTLDKVSFL